METTLGDILAEATKPRQDSWESYCKETLEVARKRREELEMCYKIVTEAEDKLVIRSLLQAAENRVQLREIRLKESLTLKEKQENYDEILHAD